MIYTYPNPGEPIRQGDIFKNIPMVIFDPSDLLVADESLSGELGFQRSNWINQLDPKFINNNRMLVRIVPVTGIVITQDCDVRDTHVAFFLVDDFIKVTKLTPKPTNTLKWWADTITRQARSSDKWFYLPPDKTLGFDIKMAADFKTIVTVPSKFLASQVNVLRVGRLNSESDEHFREKVAQFFRRYPYDEWYPLTKDEFDAYKSDPSRQDTDPRPWQA